MGRILITCMMLFVVIGCSSNQDLFKGADSPENLKSLIMSAYKDHDEKAFRSLVWKENVPKEILRNYIKVIGFLGDGDPIPIKDTVIVSAEKYSPTHLPGKYEGKSLKYNEKPVHWIGLRTEKNVGETHYTSIYEFPVCRLNHRFFICGAVYE